MTTRHPKVAAIQLNSGPNVEQNLKRAEALVREAAADGAVLSVLPECFAFLGPEEDKFALAEPLPAGGPILQRMQELARQTQCELVLGGFYEQTDKPRKVRNACIHVTEQGKVKAIYRKIHLFDVDLVDGTKLEESATVEPGSDIVATDTRAGRLGLSVCYDLRFPELYRQLAVEGAKILVVPAAFMLHTGRDHWEVLLRARAIENQCYVVAAGQIGDHDPGRTCFGRSMIIDPWGTVLAQAPDTVGIVTAEVDLDRLEAIRRDLPSLANRRLAPATGTGRRS
jgi:predicted amidohydrolase